MNFSPSAHHRYLMEHTRQSLAFDPDNVNVWKSSLKVMLRNLLGKMPDTPCELESKTLWKQRNQHGTIEKVVYTSEPYCDVPAYLCVPDCIREPETLFICLQGHSSGMHNSIALDRETEKNPIDVAGDRDFAIGCMKRGISAFCIEQRSFGFRREQLQEKVSDNMCHDAFVQSLMLGRTLLGERIYDIERGLAYLKERGSVPMNRIGIMGNSAGGTVSIYAAALLPQIDYAMPSCSFGAFKSSKMLLYHCSCGYIPNLMLYAEMADIMGLFAPNPVVIVAGEDDPIIPIASVQEGYAILKDIYRSFNAEDNCHLVIGKEGHRFYAEAAWDIMLAELS